MMILHQPSRASIRIILSTGLLAGCSGNNPNPGSSSPLGIGGAIAIGGQGQTSATTGGTVTATGGQPVTGSGGLGGAQTTGRLTSQGGTNPAGGVSARGGTTTTDATGGTLSNGGSATGGANRGGSSNGGSAAAGASAGGNTASGGTSPTGGAKAAAGASTVGGTSATGGLTATGGVTTATGGSGGTTTGQLIRNDLFWKDTAGTPIYSQGGGVLLVGDTYYWYGVKYNGAVTYAASPTKKNSDTSFAGVTIYSSKDLVNWKLENTVQFSNAGDWFGRLGVVYNSTSKKYVMVAQGAGGLFFATSSTPTGNFTFDNVQTSLTGITNNMTGDQTTFQDDDGKAYLICSSASGRAHLYVVPLRESDFLAIGTPTEIYKGNGREGNALFKYDGHYYFCSSDLHGWNASHTYCISATNILGPYGAEFVMQNTDSDFSHVTQTGFFITVKGSAQSLVIFAGDRWSDFAGNGLGYNQWMPLTFNGTTPSLQSVSEWYLDAATGKWSVGPNNNYAINPSFEADRVEVTTPAGWSTTNGANVSGGHTGNWSWQLAGSATLDQTASNLPNGTYTLSAWVKGSGATGAQLYVKGGGGTDQSTSLAAANGTWTQLSVNGVAVSNGAPHIGVSTTTGTITVDDFVLVRN
jgi:hypothetical protein